jgi:hypothetical protein
VYFIAGLETFGGSNITHIFLVCIIAEMLLTLICGADVAKIQIFRSLLVSFIMLEFLSG